MRVHVPQIFALEEDFLIANDAVVLQTGQDADLVEGILDFLLREVRQFHFLQGVYLAVSATLHPEHLGVGALASVKSQIPSFGPI